jgi:hypothetical protein
MILSFLDVKDIFLISEILIKNVSSSQVTPKLFELFFLPLFVNIFTNLKNALTSNW